MVALCTAADRVLEFRMLLNLKRMLQFNWMDFCKWFFFQLSVLYPRWAFMYLVKCILYCFRSVCISLYSISAHKIKKHVIPACVQYLIAYRLWQHMTLVSFVEAIVAGEGKKSYFCKKNHSKYFWVLKETLDVIVYCVKMINIPTVQCWWTYLSRKCSEHNI